VKESRKIATFYQGKSVAEQNTVNLTWDLFARRQLQSPANRHFSTDMENAQFQYLVVNSVMSTDMMNPDKPFVTHAGQRPSQPSWQTQLYRKTCKGMTSRNATIVIYHLIQVSDVAYAMQHWHISWK
jgi:hypothetical protein